MIVGNQSVNIRSDRFTVNTNVALLTKRMPFKQIVEDNVKRMRILNASFELIHLRQEISLFKTLYCIGNFASLTLGRTLRVISTSCVFCTPRDEINIDKFM